MQIAITREAGLFVQSMKEGRNYQKGGYNRVNTVSSKLKKLAFNICLLNLENS